MRQHQEIPEAIRLRFNLTYTKSELGAIATSQSATAEELQPKPSLTHLLK